MSVDTEGKFFIWDVSNELLYPRKMHQIVLSNNIDNINVSKVTQLKNAKNKFLVSTDVGNVKIIEVERVINDSKAGNIKSDKWSKTAIGLLSTLHKDVLYDCVTEMQISFGPKRKITVEELKDQLLKMDPYDKILSDYGLSCQYIDVSVLDISNNGMLLINKSNNSIALVDLSRRKIIASMQLDCDYIAKAHCCSVTPHLFVVLTSDQELIFFELKISQLEVVKRVFNVVNYSLSTANDRDIILVLSSDNTLEIHEN